MKMTQETATLFGIAFGQWAYQDVGDSGPLDCVAVEESDLWLAFSQEVGTDSEEYRIAFRMMYETVKIIRMAHEPDPERVGGLPDRER